MSFSDKPREPREPRAPRRARARLSLKMQAIGFLSRREHSRQELRTKLLDSLRRRAREDAALDAAADKAAQELAQALDEQPSNGIDDAFAPPASAAPPAPAPARAREARSPAARTRATASGPDASTSRESPPRAALETLRLANGAPLPPKLRASLATVDTPRCLSDAAFVSKAEADDPGAAEPSSDNDAELVEPSNDDGLELADPETAVDQLLDWLVANNYLSETRFVESRVNARSRKQGGLRIKLELSRHGLALEPEQAAALRETEFARAQALWQRKFGEVAPDARLRAKQARFLAARGFAADVVRRVVGGEEES